MRAVLLLLLFGLVLPDVARAEAPGAEFALKMDLHNVWIVTAAALVFLMQAGFLLLEAGQVRSKNSVNVAQKNLMDFIVSSIVFGCLGYMLMFGSTVGGLFGWQSDLLFFGSIGDWSLSFFLFQLLFCGTAATIVSGGVAERMSINGYLFCTTLIAAVIYPVAGHWVWGDFFQEDAQTLLAGIGFMDFAGSTVVHSVGAWVSLAAIIVIGPRIGKFDENGKPRTLQGHSPILATAGAILLWVGWIGFNGGSMFTTSGNFSSVIVNTIIAGASGGFALMFVGRFSDGCFRPSASINGVLGGLVAITASADVMTSQSAFFIGLLAGLIVHGATWILANVLKLDDPLGAIPVHGAAGAFGTVCIAWFAPQEALVLDTRFAQFWSQLQGVALVFVWAFGVAYVALKAYVYVAAFFDPKGGGGLRVPHLHEIEGLNLHEHNAPMGADILQQAMGEVARNPHGGLQKISLDYGDDAYETSVLFNLIIDNIADERAAVEEEYQTQKSERMAVEDEIRVVVKECARGNYSKRLSEEGKAGFLLELCRGINELSETADIAFRQIGKSLDGISAGDLSHHMEGQYDGSVGRIQKSLNKTLSTLSTIMAEVNVSVDAASKGDFGQRLDVANKSGFFLTVCEQVNLLCEISDRGLKELFEVLNAIGKGNLNARMGKGYQGSFAKLGDTVEDMADNIRELLSQVLSASESVQQGSSDVSTQTSNIRQQSSDQVKAMETSQEFIDELVLAVKDMAKDAIEADEFCKAAADYAETGQDLAFRTNQQVLEVANAADAISNAVERIEKIAKQSTMLSFNASVEAARNGSTGNTSETNGGFQVVAQEVRAMSKDTADAADEIRSTVNVVKKSADECVRLVEQTTKSLFEINAGMLKSSELVANLKSLGAQQNKCAEDVNDTTNVLLERATSTLKILSDTSAQAEKMEAKAAGMIHLMSHFTGIKSDNLSAA